MQIRRWLPDQPTLIGRHDWPDEGGKGTHLRLRAGSIVVLDRQAWRVLDITGYPGNAWPESYEKAWREHVELWWHANELRRAENQSFKPAPERAEFYKRPVVLALRDENLPRSAVKHWCAPASQDWQVLPEHYAVCRACGELPPCHHGEYRPEGGPRRPEQSGGIPLIVPEGCCMGCAEQIKPRMRTVRFPGPNLWYPDLGDDTAVFHSRSSCEDQVEYYRAQWQSEYAQPATHPVTPAFPGFDRLLLPRARQAQLPAPASPYEQAPVTQYEQAAAPLTALQYDQPPATQYEQAPAPQYDQTPATQYEQAPAPHTAPQHSQAQVTQHSQAQVTQHSQAQVTPYDQAPAPQYDQTPVTQYEQVLATQYEQAPAPAPHTPPQQHGQEHFAAPHAREEAPTSLATGSGTFSPSFDGYRPDPEQYAPAPPAPPQSAAPAPVLVPAGAEDAGPAARAAEELSRSLADRPVFHNAEQAARVIEELTAAVRNIALYLNNPQARSHP
ncbi:hypothetical protein [Streptomyces sp. NPDC004284]|uniref:hypothetical protein n=1 Tax=Streptomyces sp. NPDC004284 TaxID=3364695 RepID=UPI00367C1DB4